MKHPNKYIHYINILGAGAIKIICNTTTVETVLNVILDLKAESLSTLNSPCLGFQL